MCQHKGFYDRHVSPRLVHSGCSADEFSSQRERIIPHAKGIVVEIGFGSGLNLPYYDAVRVDRLIGIEPDDAMINLAKGALDKSPFPTEVRKGVGEHLPLADAMADTVVVTYALCTIPEPERALKEIRRILKPDGQLLFCEHARAAAGWRARLQRGLNGPWGKLFGGCNLIREPVAMIEGAGFMTENVVVRRFPLSLALLGDHYSGQACLQAKASPKPAPTRKSATFADAVSPLY
jgi:SAM-dependent methyltransferase